MQKKLGLKREQTIKRLNQLPLSYNLNDDAIRNEVQKAKQELEKLKKEQKKAKLLTHEQETLKIEKIAEKKINIQLTIKKKEIDQINPPNLNSISKYQYKKNKQSVENELKEAISCGKPLFHKNYGYCLVQNQFEQLLDRLQLVRKLILKKENLEPLDTYMPQSLLMQLTKYMPFDTQQLKNYQINIDQCIETIQQNIEKFLSEIRFFAKKCQIVKENIYYHEQMFEEKIDSTDEVNYDEIFDMIEKQNSKNKDKNWVDDLEIDELFLQIESIRRSKQKQFDMDSNNFSKKIL